MEVHLNIHLFILIRDSSCFGLNIVEALKLAKSRKWSKFNLTTIDFDCIDVRDDKYLLPSFD